MTTRHLLLEQWSKGIASLAGAVGTPDFSVTLLDAVRRIVDFDFIMAFAYRGRERPLLLADTLDAARHKVIAVTMRQAHSSSIRSINRWQGTSMKAATACTTSRPITSAAANTTACTMAERE